MKSKILTIYLAGAINGCSDDECKNWRRWVDEQIGERHAILDPMRRDYRGVEELNVREIVELDKWDILSSDVLIVNYSRPSVGTSMEVLYGWQNNKKIVVVCEQDAQLSPWLEYHSTTVVHSLHEAMDAIERYCS